MELLLDRKWKKDLYTVGKLYVNGVAFCETMEDTDRGLRQDMPLSKIKMIKKADITAIPTGKYNILMNVISPKYSMKPWYVQNCNGAKMPRIENVPGYSGILIHPGNTHKDSSGCVLVGINDVRGMITKSKETFLKLYKNMWAAYKRGEKITLTIK